MKANHAYWKHLYTFTSFHFPRCYAVWTLQTWTLNGRIHISAKLNILHKRNYETRTSSTSRCGLFFSEMSYICKREREGGEREKSLETNRTISLYEYPDRYWKSKKKKFYFWPKEALFSLLELLYCTHKRFEWMQTFFMKRIKNKKSAINFRLTCFRTTTGKRVNMRRGENRGKSVRILKKLDAILDAANVTNTGFKNISSINLMKTPNTEHRTK